jgi:hypothetical protein
MKNPKFIYIAFLILLFILLPSIISSGLIGEFFAYPNPTLKNQMIHIYLSNASDEEITVKINLFSLSGKKIASIVENLRITPGLGLIKEFNLQNTDIPVEPGLYLLNVNVKGLTSKKEETKTFKIFVIEDSK